MKTGAVIVNYNCAALALDAALSVLGDDWQAQVVIVDNASTDGSLQYFEDVFAGKLAHEPTSPATAQAAPIFAALSDVACGIGPENAAQLTVLGAEENKGFAAGCNLGLKFLQEAEDIDVFLLLNPDAVIAKGSLDAFRARLADPQAGLCGASVLRFENPACAQAFGGARLRPLTLLGENIGAGLSFDEAPDGETVERRMSYPLGAAMAFRKDYLDIAGYPDERFFLYYEEADWARRGLPSLRPVWARGAVVYHRHGAAAGSRQSAGERSALADYHMARSRMLYALKWRPHLLPALFLLSLGQSARRLCRGHWRQAKAVVAGVVPGTPSPTS